MNTQTKTDFCKFFDAEHRALYFARNANTRLGKHTTLVVIDGPENDFAVVDILTAIEMGCGYKF